MSKYLDAYINLYTPMKNDKESGEVKGKPASDEIKNKPDNGPEKDKQPIKED